jgi:hypothetical protein
MTHAALVGTGADRSFIVVREGESFEATWAHRLRNGLADAKFE